jgi:hypothetical protein
VTRLLEAQIKIADRGRLIVQVTATGCKTLPGRGPLPNLRRLVASIFLLEQPACGIRSAIF